jgi:hypothetical protein
MGVGGGGLARRALGSRTRHPEVRALRCTCTAGRASKDGPRAVLILRGAQERAPQDDGTQCAAISL